MEIENIYDEIKDEIEMSHLLLDRFYGIYFDNKRLDGEVLFKIFPSEQWLNCTEFKKTLCDLLREEINGEFIASSPTVDEIEALIAYHTY